MDYIGLQGNVANLLQTLGQILVVTHYDQGSLEAGTGFIDGDSIAKVSVYGATVPWQQEFIDGKKYEWNNEFHGGTSWRIDDVRCIIAATDQDGASFSIALNDTITFGGSIYVIKGLNPISPAGVVLAYDCQLRK